MNNNKTHDKYGTLYVVATPIGNREDITLRALKTLENVEVIAAEDTRRTGNFLKNHSVKGKLISYHEHNEKERTPDLIGRLKAGFSVALVSNAGTPVLSDPGFRLIKTAIECNIKVTPIPGVSAAIAALSVSGLPCDAFAFIGFPAKKKQKRLKQLEALARIPRTLIFYESPKRIAKLLEDILSVMGDRQAVVSREMTKLHEEFIRGFLSEILIRLQRRPKIKGECTLLVRGYEAGIDIHPEELEAQLLRALENRKTALPGLVKKISKKYSLPKSEVYKQAVKIKKAATKDKDNGTT